MALRTMNLRWGCVWFLAILATAFFSHRVNAAQIICFNPAKAQKALRESGEILVGFGITTNGDLMKIFLSVKGKFTVAIMPAISKGKMFCPVIWGDNYVGENDRSDKIRY